MLSKCLASGLALMAGWLGLDGVTVAGSGDFADALSVSFSRADTETE